jgi:hypothetical protein
VAVAGPDGSDYAITQNDVNFYTTDPFGNALALANPAASGKYQFVVETADEGTVKLAVHLKPPATAISPLRIANFLDAQTVDAAQDFILTWDDVKAGPKDYLRVSVFNEFASRVYFQDHINSRQSHASIGAGTLEPNKTYVGVLSVVHFFGLNTSHDPPWASVEERSTHFSLKTLNPAGVFGFAAVSVVTYETNGAAKVTVRRNQGSDGDVTVDYFATDESASANTNYVATAGTLIFPAGITNQDIPITVLNDGVASAPLTFKVTLTNATGGAGRVTRPHATVTILDEVSAPALNVRAYAVGETEFYSQSSNAAPLQSSLCEPSRFFAGVQPAFPGGASNGTVQPPKRAQRTLTDTRGNLEDEENFPSRTAMIAAFPAGKYRLTFDTLTDGSFSPTLTLGVERNFSVAQVTNWTATQNVDPAAPFTVQWTPFAGATTNDAIIVAIENSELEYLFRTPDLFLSKTLSATNTSITIPANRFEFGQAYFVNLEFAKVSIVDTNSYPGALGVLEFFHTTDFYIRTVLLPDTSGLVGWWRGDGDSIDAAGTNNGTLYNGTSFGPGVVRSAFRFDGSGGHVKIPAAPELNPGDQVTVEFWMKANVNNPLNSFQGLVNSDFYGIEISQGQCCQSIGVNFFVSTNSGAHYNQTADANGGGAPVSVGQWHHIAGTYNGTQLQLYIDGLPSGNPMPCAGPISPMLPGSFIAIGSEDGRGSCPDCQNRFYNGLIDEVAIFNRALSPDEIAALYARGHPAN